jgi:hypothetical protein
MNEYLNVLELHQLTGMARPGKQSEWLKTHSIPHRVDGTRLIVSRVHVQNWIEGRNMVSSTGLNLAGIR